MRIVRKGLLVLMLLVAASFPIAATDSITLRIGGTWPEGSSSGDMLQGLIDEYNRTQDRVRVVLEAPVTASDAAWMQPLLIAYAGGTAPDLAVTRGPVPRERGGEGGMFLALDRFIDGPRGFPRSIFLDDVWSFSNLAGRTYAVALDTNERALFVNATMIDNAGLSRNDPPQDWNEMVAWARAMTRRMGDQVEQWGFFTQHGRGGDFWHTIFLNDGEIFNVEGTAAVVDHPNTIEAIEFIADMVQVHEVAPRGAGGNAMAPFLQGEGAMMIYHSGLLGSLAEDPTFEYITVPGPPGVGKHGGRLSAATDSVLQILDTTEHPEEAWDFLRWLVVEHAGTVADARSRVPLTWEAIRDTRFQEPPWAAFAESIIRYNPRQTALSGLGTANWWGGAENMSSIVNRAINGDAPPGPALTELNRRLNAILQQQSSQ